MLTALEVDVGPLDDAPPQTLLPGLDPTRSLADQYELLQSRLGHGEFSEVRLGLRKERLSERVAVKVLSKTPNLVPERLQAEVEILRTVAMLNHQNLVKLLDVFETPTKVHLVFELLSGGTLLDHVAKHGGKPLPEAEARDLLWDVVSGLSAIHAIGIVHRDLKLQNIMLDERRRAKICDFGFAKRASAADIVTVEARRFASPCGTPGFVAPEVLGHKGYDCAADLWSLGIVAYVLLTGKPPFDKEVSSDVPAAPKALEVVRPAAIVRPLLAAGREHRPVKSSPLGEGHERRSDGDSDGAERSSLNEESSPHVSTEDASQRWSAEMSGTEADEAAQGAEEPERNDSPTNSPPGPRSAFGLLARMRNGWRFPPPAPGEPEITDGAKTFVFALLVENPSLRLSAERALKDEWLSLSSPARRSITPPQRAPGRMRAFSSPEFSAAACGGGADLEALRHARMLRRNTEAAGHLSATGAGGHGAAHEPPAPAGEHCIARGGAYARNWPVMMTTRLSESYRDTTDDDDDDDDPPMRNAVPPSFLAPRPGMNHMRSLLPTSDADDSEPESSPESCDESPVTIAWPTRPVAATRELGAQRPPAIQRRR